MVFWIEVHAHVSRRLKKSALIGRLSPTLGLEKTDQVVMAAAKRIGIVLGDEILLEHALAILEDLSQASGIVGVAARFVVARRELEALALAYAPTPAASFMPAGTSANGISAARTPPSSEARRVRAEEVIALLAPAMGEEKARAAYFEQASRMGLTGDVLPRTQAIAVLERMASADGIMGVTARFAKARLMLKNST